MSFRFTKYSVINAILSLIPSFPIFSLFPSILLADKMANILDNCEKVFMIFFFVYIVLAILSLFVFIYKIDTILKRKKQLQSSVKWDFRLFCLWIYSLSNMIIFIAVVGTRGACSGDGQTILAVIYSGPFSSFVLIILGLTIDLRLFFLNRKNSSC